MPHPGDVEDPWPCGNLQCGLCMALEHEAFERRCQYLDQGDGACKLRRGHEGHVEHIVLLHEDEARVELYREGKRDVAMGDFTFTPKPRTEEILA